MTEVMQQELDNYIFLGKKFLSILATFHTSSLNPETLTRTISEIKNVWHEAI